MEISALFERGDGKFARHCIETVTQCLRHWYAMLLPRQALGMALLTGEPDTFDAG